MKFTVHQYAEALYQAISDTHPKFYDKVIANFIQILKGNGDIARYEQVVNEYEKLIAKHNQTSHIEVTTATTAAVTPALLRELNQLAKKRGMQAEVSSKTDEQIIGGVIIKVDDTLIDASLRSQLNQLDQELKS